MFYLKRIFVSKILDVFRSLGQEASEILRSSRNASTKMEKRISSKLNIDHFQSEKFS